MITADTARNITTKTSVSKFVCMIKYIETLLYINSEIKRKSKEGEYEDTFLIEDVIYDKVYNKLFSKGFILSNKEEALTPNKTWLTVSWK